jgi:tRNA-specific 2-thiouridylase
MTKERVGTDRGFSKPEIHQELASTADRDRPQDHMTHKAIALMSGGLDSNLAVRMIHDMGIRIIGVHFTGPFCLCNRGAGGCIHYAKKIAGELGLRFSTIGLGAEYLDMVVHPKHGRGSGMNPCLDCRILMFRKAKDMMSEEGASFIFTGEVLGQRPMSQLRDKLRIIEREAELEGLILRPLSAQHLPPTIPEKEGWVNRDALLDIQGRGRRAQMDLAETLQIGDYPCPAGGCLLTDKHFAARLREHIDHSGGLDMSDIPLLKMGRHFRLPSGAKLILGRDQAENEQLERLAAQTAVRLEPDSGRGPTAVLLSTTGAPADADLAAEILGAYCKRDGKIAIRQHGEGQQRVRCVVPSERGRFAAMCV